jgi:hypothetical protein
MQPVVRDIPARNMRSVGMFQYKYSVSRNIAAKNMINVTVQQIQSVGIFSQWGSYNKHYSVSRNIPARKNQSVGIF